MTSGSFCTLRPGHAAVSRSVEVDMFPPATIPVVVVAAAVAVTMFVIAATGMGRRAAACQVVRCSAARRPAVLLAVATTMAAASKVGNHVKWCSSSPARDDSHRSIRECREEQGTRC